MTVDFNNLPCELGNPGRLPIPVDPIDGGSVDGPEDDGETILNEKDRIRPIPNVVVCISVSPGQTPTGTGRLCIQVPITQAPTTGIVQYYNSLDECNYDCIPVWICIRNKITGELQCVTVKRAEAEALGVAIYETSPACYAVCREGPDASGLDPGTPIGPSTPGPGNPGPPTPGGPPRTRDLTGGGGPSTPSYVTYYYCDEITRIVPCTYVAPGLGTGGGTGGYRADPFGDCECLETKRTCKSRWYSYYPPEEPPKPQPNVEFSSCAAIQPACRTTLELIPGSCDSPETGGPIIVEPTGPRTREPEQPQFPTSDDVNEIPETPTVTTGDGGDGTTPGGIITEPTDGTPISPELIPTNQDGDDVPFYQFDPALFDTIVDPDYTIGDETYFITTEESNFLFTTESTRNQELFKLQRDKTIEQLLVNAESILSNINKSISELSTTKIRESIKGEIADILFNLTYPDGRPISQDRISKSIRKHLLENTIDSIDTGYILLLKSRALFSPQNRARLLSLPTTQFGRSKQEIIKERQQNRNRATLTTPTNTITPNSTRGVIRALKNAKSLDPEKYSDQTKDLVRLWYILPTDINRRIIASASGNVYPIYIKDTDTISITTSAGSSVSLPVDRLNYSVSVTTSSYGVDLVESQSDINRAYALPNIVEQATLYDVGSKWETVFTVSSPAASDLELNYSLSGARPLYHVLKINRSSIEEVLDSDSIFTRKTKVRYTLETSPTNIRNAIKYRLYPWKVFTINHNDPILGHFNASSIYEFLFTNFNMQQFGSNNGEQLFVRRIPELIIILPTDKFNLNFFNGYSRLLDWNKRRIIFSQLPDPRYYNTGLDQHWIKIEDTYPDSDIDSEINVYGKKGTFTGRAGILAAGYTSGSEPLPRTKHGFRAAVELASSIYNTYEVNEGVMWSDLFVRMTRQEYQTFKIGISNEMIEKLRIGQKTGVKLLHNRNDGFIKTTRLLELRPTATSEIEIKINKEINPRIII